MAGIVTRRWLLRGLVAAPAVIRLAPLMRVVAVPALEEPFADGLAACGLMGIDFGTAEATVIAEVLAAEMGISVARLLGVIPAGASRADLATYWASVRRVELGAWRGQHGFAAVTGSMRMNP